MVEVQQQQLVHLQLHLELEYKYFLLQQYMYLCKLYYYLGYIRILIMFVVCVVCACPPRQSSRASPTQQHCSWPLKWVRSVAILAQAILAQAFWLKLFGSSLLAQGGHCGST